MDGKQLLEGDNLRQQDGHCLAVLATGMVDGDKSGGRDRLPALRWPGNFGNVDSHGLAFRSAVRGPLSGLRRLPEDAGRHLREASYPEREDLLVR